MSTSPTHQIVIIGGSFAGLTLASCLLRDVLPPITTSTKQSYKVTLINPSPDFFWKIGSPRVIVNPSSLSLEKSLLPIAPHFTKYSPDQFQFIEAYASSISAESHTVSLSTSVTVPYDSLAICSGTHFQSNLWSTTPGSAALKAAMSDMHARLPAAQTVLVAGGGPAGIETAGELGEVYGNGKKDITLLSGGKMLLGRLQNKNVGKDAQARLEKMGIKVVHDVQVTSHTAGPDGKEVLQLSNGETRTVDVYIEAIGDKPNSSFVPQEWVTERGQVKTDAATLRLDVPGVKGVYVFGTVGSYSNGSITDVMFAKKAVLESIKLDLQGTEPGPRTKNVYKKITSDMQFVPIGSQQGVGIAFGWKLPSFMVKMAKSKDFMIGNAVKYIEGTA